MARSVSVTGGGWQPMKDSACCRTTALRYWSARVPADRRQRGIALVLVLWLLVLMTVIASSHARNTRVETSLAFNHVGSAQAHALAEAGINRAIMELFVTDTNTRWPLDGSAHQIRLDSGSVNVAIRDASGLLDLNKADTTQLEAILEAAGAGEGVRQRLVDAILDWRDKDSLRRLHGAEDNDYRHAGLDWGARDAPYTSVDELRYVLGMTNELFERLAPYLTVHSASPKVNLKYAPPWLFSALTNSQPETTDSPPIEDAQPAGPFHITAWATSNRGSRASIEAVIGIARTGEEPYAMLSWREPARSRKMTPG
jgi:general secretion pathway protein K